MAAPWEAYGAQPAETESGPWNQYGAAQPTKIGADAFPDFLKAELANAGPVARNLASFGTSLSDIWQGAKQFVGQGDQQAIQANKIIRESAPMGAVAGDMALSAIPFGLAGNTVKAAAGVGTVLGALQPVSGDQGAANIVQGKVLNAMTGGAGAALGQGLANGVGSLVDNATARLAVKKAQNEPLDKTIQDAVGQGYVIPPSSANPSLWNTLREGIAGKTAVAQAASNKNTAVTDTLLRRDLGLPESAPLTTDTMQAIRQKAYETGYKPIADLPAVPADEGLLNGLISLSPKNAGGAVPNPAQGQIDDLVNAIANKGQWTGPQLIRDIQSLREQANANFSKAAREGGDVASRDLGRAMIGAADQLEQLGSRQISPDAVQALKDARTLIAKSHTAQDAIIQGGGTADARVFARRAQNEKPMSDTQAVIGNFANNFPRAVQPDKNVAGPGISKLDWAMALSGGGLGAMSDGKEGGILGTVAPLVASRAMRARLLSKGSQNALRDIYNLPLPARMANSLLQYAPVGGAVLGLDAFSK